MLKHKDVLGLYDLSAEEAAGMLSRSTLRT